MGEIFSIKDKVIVITGATSYLASSMVEDLTKVKAKVVLLVKDLNKAYSLCEKIDLPKTHVFEVDISSKQSIENCFLQVSKTFKNIDVLVNNATFVKAKPFGKYEKEDWQYNFDGTIISVDMVTQEVLKYMKNKGRIINISSMYGMVSPDESIYEDENSVNPIAYGVGKAGLIQYTKYAAMKLAKKGINVNTISFGPFPNKNNVKDEKFLKALANKTFLKRVGNPKEVSAAVFFLSLDENSFLTGQNIVVDGGWTSW